MENEKQIQAKLKAQELIITAMAWEKVKPKDPLVRLVQDQFTGFVERQKLTGNPDQELIDLVRAEINGMKRQWPMNR